MKKRLIILFILTIIISLIILCYNPNSEYLGVYKDTITIEYDYDLEGYSWEYTSSNKCLELSKSTNNKWIFKPIKNGECTLTFTYKSNEDVKYKIVYDLKIKNNKIYWTDGYAEGLLDYPNPV